MRKDEITFIEYLLKNISGFISTSYSDRDNLSVYTKSNLNDFLTVVDVNVQECLVKSIKKSFPDDSILAEESGLDERMFSTQNRCWIIDPIDGTQNFLRGLFPEFGVSIGFMEHGKPMAGGVILPGTGDLFLAERKAGAFRNNKRMKVSNLDNLSQSRIDIDLGGLDNREDSVRRARNIFEHAGQIRSYGCAVIGFCQVADGLQDAYITFQAKPWDIAAGQLMVEEAGGMVTSFTGEILTPYEADRIGIISNGVLHSACLNYLNN